ncbi:hypothetical protein BC830DRAFT_816500 [Chytriomyces sp. MP71]|nr:hypothetical protein BC830DRAFT_816500 [Chytriomyces sp. MP71]
MRPRKTRMSQPLSFTCFVTWPSGSSASAPDSTYSLPVTSSPTSIVALQETRTPTRLPASSSPSYIRSSRM